MCVCVCVCRVSVMARAWISVAAEVRFKSLPLQRTDVHMHAIKIFDIARHKQRVMCDYIQVHALDSRENMFLCVCVCVCVCVHERTSRLSTDTKRTPCNRQYNVIT